MLFRVFACTKKIVENMKFCRLSRRRTPNSKDVQDTFVIVPMFSMVLIERSLTLFCDCMSEFIEPLVNVAKLFTQQLRRSLTMMNVSHDTSLYIIQAYAYTRACLSISSPTSQSHVFESYDLRIDVSTTSVRQDNFLKSLLINLTDLDNGTILKLVEVCPAKVD